MKLTLLIFFILSCLVLSILPAKAQDGTLDSTFGINGVLATSPYSGMSMAPTGKFYQWGRSTTLTLSVIRRNPDGSVDSTFGTNGVATIDFNYGRNFRIWSYLFNAQPDGRLLVAAAVDQTRTYPTPYSWVERMILVQLDLNGTIEFYREAGSRDIDKPSRLFVQPDGKILMSGVSYYTNSSNYHQYAELYRFTASGVPDYTFGTYGLFELEQYQNGICNNCYGGPIAAQPSGKIIEDLGGELVRVSQSGTLDTLFGNGGHTVSYNSPNGAMMVQPDGKIIFTDYKCHIWRYNINGHPDNSFGTNGISQSPDTNALCTSLCIQPDGKIIAAGQSYDSLGKQVALCVRYTSDGLIDSSFANNGVFKNPTSGGSSVGAISLFADKIYLFAYNYYDTTNPALCIRLNNTHSTFPLTFINFTASKQGERVALKWVTEQEKNISHFEIERSLNGINWATINTTRAHGESASQYQAIDQNIPQTATNLYYRLRLIDNDGHFTYSKTAVVKIASQQDLVIYPNPANNKVTITGSTIKRVVIVDNDGRVLSRTSYPSLDNVVLSTSLLKPATYVLRVETEGGQFLRKLVISR